MIDHPAVLAFLAPFDLVADGSGTDEPHLFEADGAKHAFKRELIRSEPVRRIVGALGLGIIHENGTRAFVHVHMRFKNKLIRRDARHALKHPKRVRRVIKHTEKEDEVEDSAGAFGVQFVNVAIDVFDSGVKRAAREFEPFSADRGRIPNGVIERDDSARAAPLAFEREKPSQAPMSSTDRPLKSSGSWT